MYSPGLFIKAQTLGDILARLDANVPLPNAKVSDDGEREETAAIAMGACPRSPAFARPPGSALLCHSEPSERRALRNGPAAERAAV